MYATIRLSHALHHREGHATIRAARETLDDWLVIRERLAGLRRLHPQVAGITVGATDDGLKVAWQLPDGMIIDDHDVAIEVVEDAVWLCTETGNLRVRIPLADISSALLRGVGWVDPV